MPCFDGRERENDRLNAQMGAVLCGVIKAHGIGILDDVDWNEVGIVYEKVIQWWERHLCDEYDRAKRGWK